MLLVAALLCALIAYAHGRTDHSYVRHWMVLSVTFGLLSLDEFASIHEQTGDRLREQFGITGGPLYFASVIPRAALVVLFGIALLRFFKTSA